MATAAQESSKRKREEETRLEPLQFSFDQSFAVTSKDGTSSPRTTVAHRFRKLELRDSDNVTQKVGGVTFVGVGLEDSGDDISSKPSKRQRSEDTGPKPEEVNFTKVTFGLIERNTPGTEGTGEPAPALSQSLSTLEARPDCATSDEFQTAKPVVDVPNPKLVGKRRAGTPPLKLKRVSQKSLASSAEVVDPIRAALTWHEDEITIYDPNDKDDDGTGINGVGFKPTPAMAQARTAKRRQQMAEYKHREESEARARRNQRRRGHHLHDHAAESRYSSPPGSQASVGTEVSPRKVRFSEEEGRNIAIKS